MGHDRWRGFARYQMPAILWALLIFASSSMPGWVFPRVAFPHIDTVVHFCYYFVFAILMARALKFQSRLPVLARFSLTLSFLLATAYGVSDETHQLFVAGRTSDPRDLLADMAGAFVALLIIGVARRVVRRKGPQKRQLKAGIGPN